MKFQLLIVGPVYEVEINRQIKSGKMPYCMLQKRNETNVTLKFTFLEIATICPLTLLSLFDKDLQYFLCRVYPKIAMNRL